ncbi:hypothetical protein QJQ45_003691 [Haematococcus lacustris]|nr:hypothetical protein QJQ45_003691 [Haematococcus lacustris]
MATLPYISPPILVLNASTSFVEWKGNAQGALMMAGCWSAMCGTDSDPAHNERAYAWLLCCCKGHYLSMVQAAKTAPAAWKALIADQQRTGFSHCSELWHQINHLQLGSGESISQLCSRLSDLVLELAEADETVSEAVQNAEARVRNQQPAQLAAIHASRRSSASPASSSSRHSAAKPGADPSPSSPSPTALSRVKCFKCGKRGHIARDCEEPGGSSSSGSSSGGGGGAAGGGAGGGGGAPGTRGADKGRAASSATAGLFHANLMAMQAVPSGGASVSGGVSESGGASGSGGASVGGGADGSSGSKGEVQCCWSHAVGLSSLYPSVTAKPTPSLAAAAKDVAMPCSSGLLSSERFWLAVSGASYHITPDRSLLHDIHAVDVVFDEMARGVPLPVSEVAEAMATTEELSVQSPDVEPGSEPATGGAGGKAVGADSSGADNSADSAASAGGDGASASAAEPAAGPVPLRQSLRLQGLPPAGSLAACVLELPAAAVCSVQEERALNLFNV